MWYFRWEHSLVQRLTYYQVSLKVPSLEKNKYSSEINKNEKVNKESQLQPPLLEEAEMRSGF